MLNQLIVEGQRDAADAVLEKFAGAFAGRLYVELQRHGLAEERAAEDALLDMAYSRGLPLVATNDVHFGRAKMYEAHDALLCIADGAFVSQDDRRRLTREHRFKTASEMQVQFCRPARSDREHGGDCPALCLPARQAQAHPAGVRAGIRQDRGRGDEGAGPGRGWSAA